MAMNVPVFPAPSLQNSVKYSDTYLWIPGEISSMHHLQWTMMGQKCLCISFVVSRKCIKADVVIGIPCSGQVAYWNCVTNLRSCQNVYTSWPVNNYCQKYIPQPCGFIASISYMSWHNKTTRLIFVAVALARTCSNNETIVQIGFTAA